MARRQRPNLFFTGCGASWAEKVTGKVPLALLRDPEAQADAAMLVSIEPARAGVDLHTFECAVCNHVLETLAAYDDPMKSKGLERWLQGDLHPPK
jgi:hypothetical protein